MQCYAMASKGLPNVSEAPSKALRWGFRMVVIPLRWVFGWGIERDGPVRVQLEEAPYEVLRVDGGELRHYPLHPFVLGLQRLGDLVPRVVVDQDLLGREVVAQESRERARDPFADVIHVEPDLRGRVLERAVVEPDHVRVRTRDEVEQEGLLLRAQHALDVGIGPERL